MSDDTSLSTTRPMSTRQKTLSILLNSSAILALGYCCYILNETSLKFALDIFDDIIDIIETPTEKQEQKQKTEKQEQKTE